MAVSEQAPPHGLFGALFARVFIRERSAGPAPSLAVTPETSKRLETALEQMRERLREFEEGASEPGRASATAAALHSEHRDSARLALQDAIQQLHERLASGIEPAEMMHLRRLLEGHAPGMHAGPRASIEEQIEAAVLQDILRRVAVMAWERLQVLMERAGMEWPAPQDLVRGREGDDLRRALEQHRREVRETFLEASPEKAAALICGEVASWSDYYPRPGSALWEEAALRGVAAALEAQLLALALEVWLWKPLELDHDIDGVLAPHLGELQGLLREGVTSIEAARRVSQEIEEACRVVVPELVWRVVEPHLSWECADRTHVLEAVARGELAEDPVCGMGLTAEQSTESLRWGGRVLHFCSRGCRERFEREPERYRRTD